MNLHGGEGRNIPIDYAIELLNGEVKPGLKHKYGSLTTKTIERVGRSIKGCKEIEKSIDIQTGKFSAIGRHKEHFFENDVKSMVGDLKEERLFESIPGRYHPSFKSMRARRKINWEKIDKWLKVKIDELAKQQEVNLHMVDKE